MMQWQVTHLQWHTSSQWHAMTHFFASASKGFMKALKAFTKPFEALQRSVKIQI